MTSIIDTWQEWRQGKTDALPDGPWKSEPDKAQWIDEATGLDCLIVRNGSGALCGYVGVPPEHPWHGKDYFSECLATVCLDKDHPYGCYFEYLNGRVDVHGSLTFASGCDEAHPEGICHVPAPGRPGDVWWFGFDCAHYMDYVPDYDWSHDGTYRDVSYVKGECTSLASQLVSV